MYTVSFPGRLSLDSQEGDSGLDSGTERFPSLSEVSAKAGVGGEPHLKPSVQCSFSGR